MLVLVLLALAVPAVSVAGGSAGDQQYTDPFPGGGGTQTAPTTTSSAPATTTSSPAPAPTPSSPAVPSSTPATPASTAGATTAADPTATIAGTGTGTSSSTLPYTGYDAWTAVGFGLTMVVGGVALRWRLRTRRT